jgi:hypothetical protein
VITTVTGVFVWSSVNTIDVGVSLGINEKV